MLKLHIYVMEVMKMKTLTKTEDKNESRCESRLSRLTLGGQ